MENTSNMASIFPPENQHSEEPDNNQHKTYRFRSIRQERIYVRLGKLVSSGIAYFYQDACRLVDERVPYKSVTHLVGHLLREIESAIRDVLAITVLDVERKERLCERENKSNHETIILNILNSLDIPIDKGAGKAWLDIADRLHGLAHRRSLFTPRPFDEDFKSYWDGMEIILDEVLDRFEARYNRVFNQLDRLLEKETPLKEDVKYFIEKVPYNDVTHRYFLFKLSFPGWIDPLRKKHVFTHPPDSGHWPESEYLVRMAKDHFSNAHHIQAVYNAATSIPDTPNEWIHSDLVECAIVMPPKLAAPLANKEIAWIKTRDRLYSNMPYYIGDLIEQLARNYEHKLALKLATTRLYI